jgi:succinyl-diaminopimelate desuccinylase
MRTDEAGTWGEPFDEAELPRRDRIPPSGFTRPGVEFADADKAALVPAFRRQRVKRWKRVATGVVVALLVYGALIVRYMVRVGDAVERKFAMIPFFIWIALAVAGFFVLRRLGRWAMVSDPAETPHGRWKATPPVVPGYAGTMALDLHAPVDELALHLIDIESVSGDEGAIADAVEKALRAVGHLEVIRDGDALVARTSLGRRERVAIVGHLDTVPIRGNVPGRLDGGELWGRGAVDMKAGVAAFLSLAAEMADPTRDVTWIFYDHEEVDAALNGLGRLARNRPDLLDVDFAVLGEPTSAAIEGGCNGTLRVEARIPGVAAHSARAWKGANAIHAAAPVLAALGAFSPDTVNVDGLAYRESLNAVRIAGGIANNMIPAECVVTINYRYAPDKGLADALAVVTGVLAGAGVDGLAVEVTDHGEACRPGLDAPLARSFVDAVAATGVPAPSAKFGWTDVARFGSLGIPAVNYGPGDPELAHSDDERVAVREITMVREGLAAWLRA